MLALKEKRSADAIALLESAEKGLKPFTGGNPAVWTIVARIQANLAMAHALAGDHEAAVRAYRKAEPILAPHEPLELARCREVVLSHIDDWTRLTERIGFWVDTEHAYKTLDTSYVESVWWALKTIYDKDLLFEKLKVKMIPGDGFLPATVPAAFGSWAFALQKFGTLTLADVLV